jgi:hypothetical protein
VGGIEIFPEGEKMTYLDICAAHAECMYRRLDTRLGAAGIDDHVCARPQTRGLDHLLCILFRRDPFTLEGMRRRVLERELGPLLVDVHRHDLGGSVSLRNRTAQQAHRAGAKHNNTVSVLDTSLPRNVHSNCSRLHESSLLQRHLLRELIAKVFREGVVSCKRAVVRGSSCKRHSRTKVVFALQTPHAPPAGHTRLHCDAVTNFQRSDFVAHC